MGLFSKKYGSKAEKIVAKASEKKLEALVKTSDNETLRYLAAKHLGREEIWQYMVLRDPGNSHVAMLNCRDFRFLEKLMEQNPDIKYSVQKHMDEIAFSAVKEKIGACSDQEKLFALVMNGKTDIPEYKYLYTESCNRIRSQALGMITDQEALYQIAVDKDGDIGRNAAARISDPELLVRIALNPGRHKDGKYSEALSRLHDTDSLRYVAEHSEDSYIVQLARNRYKEEKCVQLCHNNHNWIHQSTKTKDDGDSPRFDYVVEKCAKCGVIRRTTYIAGHRHADELLYDAVE